MSCQAILIAILFVIGLITDIESQVHDCTAADAPKCECSNIGNCIQKIACADPNVCLPDSNDKCQCEARM